MNVVDIITCFQADMFFKLKVIGKEQPRGDPEVRKYKCFF